ncbi:MAG: hypothetical protein KGI33_08175 [Thaumarchaeota archaeon]|nr:hypothetical protein [Nitrososphaerota archaeon]
MEAIETGRRNFGWFYYKRGRYFGVVKNHYLPPGKWQTLCGNHTVDPSDMQHVRFTDAEQLFRHKLCKSCAGLLNSKSTVLAAPHRDGITI